MMRHRIIVYVLSLMVLAACLAGGCGAAPAQPAITAYWPTQDWRSSTPEEQGLESTKILTMLQEIRRQDWKIHSILIIRHGYLVTEVYFPPYQQDMRHPIFSATKSVTSLLVGMALQEGHLKSLQQPVLDFFPDIAAEATDPRLKDVTIEHLLTMSAGYNTITMPNLIGKDASFDVPRHILTYNSILEKPGSSFSYDSGLPHLLSAIVQRTTGLTLQDYARQKLFEPLGIREAGWQADPQGVTMGNTGLQLRPRDMAKIGYLVLQQGQWAGASVVPADWVAASTTKHIETRGLMNAAEDDGYGYLWWIDSWGGYSAHGFGGQYIFVFPALDMVAVFTSGLPDPIFPLPKQLVKSYVLPAVQSAQPIAANPEAFRALENQIRAIEHPAQSVAPLPEIARRISGKTYQVTQGSAADGWFQAITLTFAGGSTYQLETQWPGSQTVVVEGGLDNVFHLNPVRFNGSQPATDLLVALRGHWQDDDTFVAEYVRDLKTDIELVTLKSTFEGDRVLMEMTSSMQPVTLEAVAEMTR